MSDSLLYIAIQNYDVAAIIHNYHNGPDKYQRYICFHLQQAVEFGIKHVLYQKGIKFPNTHDIELLLRIAKGSDVETMATDYIRDNSDRLTSWASPTSFHDTLSMWGLRTALNEVEYYIDVLRGREIAIRKLIERNLKEGHDLKAIAKMLFLSLEAVEEIAKELATDGE